MTNHVSDYSNGSPAIEVMFRRCSALFIDLLVVVTIYFILYILISGLIFDDKIAHAAEDTPWKNPAIFIFLATIPILYFSVFDGLFLKGTIGKLILRLMVVRKNGKRVRIHFSFIRGIVKVLSIFFFPLLITGFLTRKNRTIHDYCSGTVVKDWGQPRDV